MWFFYALLFALITSFGILFAKKIMLEIDEYAYLWLINLFTIPFLAILILAFYQIPHVDKSFIELILLDSVLGVVAALAAYRAIRIADISLVGPISAFNPVFTALISSLFLSEKLTGKGGAGILLICCGAYLLNRTGQNQGFLITMKKLFFNKGVQLSLFAYFIWAITPIFEKAAIFHTTPQVPPFTALVGLTITDIVYGILALRFSKKSLYKVKRFVMLFLFLGILGAIGQASAMLAFSSGFLGYVTSVFKLSIIFSVVIGWFFLKEKNIQDRFFGALVMMFGVILLVL